MYVECNINPISIYSDINDGKQNFDLNKSCRICLSHDINMINMFEDINNKIIDKIEFCTGIQLKEEKDFPSSICGKCFKELSISYKFKTICLLTTETLRQIILKRIKIESPEINIITDENTNFDEVKNSDLNEIEVGNEECEDISNKDEKCPPSKIKRQKLFKEKQSKAENKTVKKRGPYKKGCPRVRKYKFSKLKCDTCDIKFATKEESDKHRKDTHLENIGWMCEVCGKTFVHRGSLYTHARSHMPPRYSCEHCDYSSAIKYDLEKHLRIHFGVKLYACASCPSRFHTTSNLRSHERRAHGPPERRHACTRCGRRFRDRCKLARHVDSHYDVKRFKCDVCLERFSRRCHWKKHLEKQHAMSVPPQRPGRRPTREVMAEMQ